MREIIIRCLIFSLSAVIILLSANGISAIVLIDLVLSFLALDFWLSPAAGQTSFSYKQIIAIIFYLTAALAVCFFPQTMGFLPSVFFAVSMKLTEPHELPCRTKLIAWGTKICLGVAVVAWFVGYVQYHTPYSLGNLSERMCSLLIFALCTLFILIAVVFALCQNSCRKLEHEYKILRDDGEEQRRKLKHQNQQLIEAKDGELIRTQLEERNRIAREIHDNVGHTLSRAILQMGALLAIHKAEPLNSQLNAVRQTLDLTMNNIRESVHNLHDESIRLPDALKQTTSTLEEQFTTRLYLDVSDNVPKEIKYAVIGIVKEGVSNIIKHSKNDTADIYVQEHPGFYQIIVHDYPTANPQDTTMVQHTAGPDVSQDQPMPKNEGIGLENIYSRAEKLGGKVRITTDNGFKIFVTIPKGETDNL